MRPRDDKKQEALLLATIKLVNESGFASSSVSKIAKEAGVSPATLYIYFKNKEDLLVSTYVEIKSEISAVIHEGVDESEPLYDNLYRVWKNLFAYVSKHVEEFHYTEQFANSPYSDLVDREQLTRMFDPLARIIQKGIEQRIIKDVDMDLVGAFMFHPVIYLASPKHCRVFEPTEEKIEQAFRMAWDALRL